LRPYGFRRFKIILRTRSLQCPPRLPAPLLLEPDGPSVRLAPPPPVLFDNSAIRPAIPPERRFTPRGPHHAPRPSFSDAYPADVSRASISYPPPSRTTLRSPIPSQARSFTRCPQDAPILLSKLPRVPLIYPAAASYLPGRAGRALFSSKRIPGFIFLPQSHTQSANLTSPSRPPTPGPARTRILVSAVAPSRSGQ
jgi:hypothetical protein